MTSTMQIHPTRREILFHRAKAVDNVVIDRACRTKPAGEVVGDTEKLFTFWRQYGWHRVTFYSDLRELVKEPADVLKFRLLEEAQRRSATFRDISPSGLAMCKISGAASKSGGWFKSELKSRRSGTARPVGRTKV